MNIYPIYREWDLEGGKVGCEGELMCASATTMNKRKQEGDDDDDDDDDCDVFNDYIAAYLGILGGFVSTGTMRPESYSITSNDLSYRLQKMGDMMRITFDVNLYEFSVNGLKTPGKLFSLTPSLDQW